MNTTDVCTPMPRYRSHKEVWALKIKGISSIDTEGNTLLFVEDPGYEPITVSEEYTKKHNLQVGGYYVVYADGYKSWSPAKVFEESYTRID